MYAKNKLNMGKSTGATIYEMLKKNRTKSEIMTILKNLHAEGRTVIIITHDNDIAANAERIVHIEDGKITSDSANSGNLSREDIDREIKAGTAQSDFANVATVDEEEETSETTVMGAELNYSDTPTINEEQPGGSQEIRK